MIPIRLHAIFILGLTFLFACRPEPTTVFPGEEWLRSSPEEQGVDPEKMQKALDYLESFSKHNGNREVVIIRNGYMIFDGGQSDSVHNIWSCSKTFTSAVLGLLIDEGRISMDDKASDFEPLLEEFYPEVSFRQFASMTSGYSARGRSRWEDTDYSDWSWTVYEPEEPLFPAGSAFAYWDEAQMMFGRVLTQILEKSMQSYLTEKITDHIGMGSWQWLPEKEVKGITINNGCTNVYINAKQFARWGWLFLNKGHWDGTQLLSKDWISQATSVQVEASLPTGDTDRKETVGSGCYGFNWWINGRKANGQLKLPGAPEGCFFASGLNNNKCVVLPQWNMVVVRMGEDGHPENPDQVYGTFLKLLEESLIHK